MGPEGGGAERQTQAESGRGDRWVRKGQVEVGRERTGANNHQRGAK